jgi:6,7-dimethyl-8-ribityllumazine synthase
MATDGKNLSLFDRHNLPDGAHFRVGIVVSEWNEPITTALLHGALEVFASAGVPDDHLVIQRVPGAFELPLAAQWLFEHEGTDGVLVVGSVIRGETPHFDFVCNACAQGVMQVGLKAGKPVVFCVLTDENWDQARDRSGGKHGNKGIECAVACLQMMDARRVLTTSATA